MKDPFCSSTKESAETSKVFFCQNVSKKNDIFQKSYHQGKMTKVQNTPFFDHKSQNTTKGNVKTGFQRQQKTATKAPPRETHKHTKPSSNQKSEDRFQGPQRHYKSFPWETFIKNEAKQTEEFLGFA